MTLFTRLRSLARAMFLRSRWERDMNEELQFHIEERAEHLVKSGVPQHEAMRRARLEFGGIEGYKETCREARGLRMVDELRCDLRYALRSFRKSPGFTAVAVLSLALGIGLNSAIFSAINAVLLRQLPYKDPERIVQVAMSYDNQPTGTSPADYLEWENQNHVFERMAAFESGIVPLVGDRPERIISQRVSASFFPILGVQPALGRTFRAAEDKPESNVVVMSHGLWRRRFGSDPNILGRNFTIDNASYRVIGVMPERFRYFEEANIGSATVDVWLPYPFATNPTTNRDFFTLSAIARLKPGVALEQASANMRVIWQRQNATYHKADTHLGVRVIPILESVAGDSQSSLLLVWGAVGLVLLIACANIANLLLARAAARTREIAIRVAIGAGRRRIVRQLLTENMLLALAGGATGLVLAHWSASLLNGIVLRGMLRDKHMFRLEEARLDSWVLWFTLALSLVTGVLFGLVPALRASNVELNESLTVRGTGEDRHGSRFRSGLVVLQVALSVVLLAGAGLMINSFSRLHQVRLGFNPHHLLAVRCTLPAASPYFANLGFQPLGDTSSKYLMWKMNSAGLLFPGLVIDRLRQLPGIQSAAVAVYGFPFIGPGMYPGFSGFYTDFKTETQSARATRGKYAAMWAVTPGYFNTLGIRLIRGRDFNDRDTSSAPDAVIVNSTMARKSWPDRPDVVGKRVVIGDQPYQRSYEIVGVVDDIQGYPASDPEQQMYFAQAQPEKIYPPGGMEHRRNLFFLVRTETNPAESATAVRNAILEMGKGIVVDQIRTMDDAISDALGPWRYTMLLLGFLGGLAVLLSGIGIYGVISYGVSRRAHEIGVRMALGAGRWDVIRLMMKGGLLLALVGVLAGSSAAYWLTRLVTKRLYQVTPTDPVTFASVALVLIAVAMVACYLPARRAARLDPMAALRCD
jgi:ABC-type lipoprotein release transport system permease subunit